MASNDPDVPDIPRDVRDGDVFGVVERLKRENAQFSCFGMSCGMTVAVLIAVAVLAYVIRLMTR
jgi:hypothetical protein